MPETKHLLSRLCGDKQKPLVMGILNITPDSFFDGNEYINTDRAISHAINMIENGVDIIDIGGESTRPGSHPISTEEELKRVIPVLKSLKSITSIPISIDTSNAKTVFEAIKNGVDIINNVNAMGEDKEIIEILRDHPTVGYIVMHMQGNPSNMQNCPIYENVVEDIVELLRQKIDNLVSEGIEKTRTFLDPGIGFGKTLDHNLTIFANLDKFKKIGLPLVIGASRKRFIGEINTSDPIDRIGGSLAVTSICDEFTVDLVRVHDVKEHVQFLQVLRAIKTKF